RAFRPARHSEGGGGETQCRAGSGAGRAQGEGALRRPRPRGGFARAAELRGPRRLREGRDGQVVADHQVRQHQSGMKAAFFRSYGPPEVLEYGELPDPVPGPGEILVEVHAASINAADWKMRAGQYGAAVGFPHIPGRDFSGVVAALGNGANDFKVGDAVWGVCEVPREGAYAEKIAIRQEIVARKPETRSHVQCAAVALAGLTALISLEETLNLKAGETILVQGGAGGVAGFAIGLAKHLGARVITR